LRRRRPVGDALFLYGRVFSDGFEGSDATPWTTATP
jgi:hypothetical protein